MLVIEISDVQARLNSIISHTFSHSFSCWNIHFTHNASHLLLDVKKKKHLRGKIQFLFYPSGGCWGHRQPIHMLFECVFFFCSPHPHHLCKIEFYESKQNDMFMDVCPLDKLLSQCHISPITSWWEPCNFREWGERKNQREIIKDSSAVWPTCKVFLLLRVCAVVETGWTECTQQRSWIKHDQIKAKHAENTGKVRKNPGHNYGWGICQECTN